MLGYDLTNEQINVLKELVEKNPSLKIEGYPDLKNGGAQKTEKTDA
jgi:hypothetical protein